MLVDD